MDQKDYYCQHSKLTDPGKLRSFYDGIPDTVEDIVKSVQEVSLYMVDAYILKLNISKERMQALSCSSVREIIELLIHLKNQPLCIPREFDHKIIANCRNMALLLCSIMREKNIPSRLRIGFSNYMMPFFYHDKVIVEYWNSESNKWQIIDIILNELNIKSRGLKFGPTNVPDGKYIYSFQAWKSCKNNPKTASKFGAGVDGVIDFRSGKWYARNIILRDFAMINKEEHNFTKTWGIMKSYVNDDISLNNDSDQLSSIDTLTNCLEELNHNSNDFQACKSNPMIYPLNVTDVNYLTNLRF